jgi:hypothetical protein
LSTATRNTIQPCADILLHFRLQNSQTIIIVTQTKTIVDAIIMLGDLFWAYCYFFHCFHVVAIYQFMPCLNASKECIANCKLVVMQFCKLRAPVHGVG